MKNEKLSDKALNQLVQSMGHAGSLVTFYVMDEREHGEWQRYSNAFLASKFNVSESTIKRWHEVLREAGVLEESAREIVNTRQGPRDRPRKRRIRTVPKLDFIAYCQKQTKRTAQWLTNRLAPRININTSLIAYTKYLVAQMVVQPEDAAWLLRGFTEPLR